MSTLFSLVARLWWQVARRAWRHNTLLPALLALFTLVHGLHTLRAPAAGRGAYLSLLFAAALGVALLAPLEVRATRVMAPGRFDLLPIAPFHRFLLRPLFGNLLRLAMSFSALAWGIAAAVFLAPSAARAAVEIVQLLGWTAAGVLAAELLEEALERRPSLPLNLASRLPLAAAVGLLAAFGRVRGWLAGLPRPGHAAEALRIGGGAPPAWELGAALGALLAVAAVLALGRWLSARLEAPAPAPGGSRPLARVASRVGGWAAPRSPALFAREVALQLRVAPLYVGHFFLLACAAAAFSAGNPALLAAGFLLAIASTPNLLGPDVPLGGLTRLALLPLPARRVLALRHAGFLFAAAVTVAAALALVLVLRGTRLDVLAAPAPYAASFGYGATLFLLFTVAGDRISRRAPQAVGPGLRVTGQEGAGTASATVVSLAALGVTLAAAGLLLVAAGAAAAALASTRDGDAPLPLVLLLASLLHVVLYALGLCAHGRAR